MNELDETRAMRSDVPLPDSAWLAPQRDRLTEELRRRTAVRTAPFRRRAVLMSAAAVAAFAVAGAIVVTLPDDDNSSAAHGVQHVSGPQLLSAQASADTLELAAATVEKTRTTEPGPKQWVYVKSTGFVQGKPQSSEEWTRWDGTGAAHLPGMPTAGYNPDFDPDKLQIEYFPNQEKKWKKEGYDDRSQRQFYRFLAPLPSDPDRMMQSIRKKHAIGDIKGETTAERDWREIDVLYRSVLIPPNVQAGLFRALAKVSGARVEKGVKDPLGRPAIGVAVNYTKPSASGCLGKQELFFDPETFTYLGETSHAAPPRDKDGKLMKNVDQDSLTMTSVRNAWGVVDKPGARP
ncbi:CU044_5270 family protein [Streptomyces beijiangensis]|uniref:CU044_5270 family protein n=1 Tax=Streptomyces beijiangensis TaxID=163361 RepID=A0A939F5U8_9ACTN|nr:CU044_5270 family protein [Streptomyces beijiangensis]MBO0511572.1 CU044_5270 family protein [Streptomyces beijiangensis]